MTIARALHAKALTAIKSALSNRFFLWNIFGNIAPLLFALAAIPYIYEHSSKVYVGFLTVTWAAIGYAGLFDFGISRAIFYFSSLSRSKPEIEIKGTLRSAALFVIIISIFLNVFAYFFGETILTKLKVYDADQVSATFIILLCLPIYLISNMVRSALEGVELFKEAAVFKFISYASLFVCPAVLVLMGDKSVTTVCIMYGIVRLVACVYALLKLLPHLGHLDPSLGGQTPVPLRAILGFGGWATVSSTVSPLMVYGDRFAIAYFNGAAALAIYAILQEFIGKTILLSASYVTSIQPRLGYLPERDAAQLYRTEHHNVVVLSVIVYSAVLLTSPFFVSRWLGVPLHDVAFMAVIMSIGFMFNSIAQAPLTYLLARGHPRRIAFAHLFEALTYFPLLTLVTYHFGVTGAVVIGMMRQLLDYGILSWQAQTQAG